MIDERVEVVRLSDGCLIHTSSVGAGQPPVVLCHGGPGLWDYLRPLAAMLEGVATTHRWEQRGNGRSSRLPPYTLERFVADLDELREYFGYGRWVVGGHSWGATLALAYALRHPARTRALVYIDGTGIGSAWRGPHHAEQERRLRANGDLPRWAELRARDRTPEEERELCLLTWTTDCIDAAVGRETAAGMLADGFLPNYEVNRALSRVLDDEHTMVRRCRALDVSTLVLHGDGDPRPPSAVASLVEALPDARYELITGAGHLPWVEQPAVVSALLREFVAELMT